ncbi:GTPase HflX [Maritalea porphyrae]|uniref:GTPase HflX n=1 Tax=Maritalea porphyrae TaxID=880732 RepID=A0ABQ5UT24_9HYPH|nr:GTPase HflX [Maritalea porphyrae]GLQ18438.1 GTPase HflX [Maritalea porphyrae]
MAATRTLLVCPDVARQPSRRTIEARLEEFKSLASAINLEIIDSQVVNVREVKPATFLGGGHVDTLQKFVEEESVALVLIDVQLSPIQQRNLETRLGAKVLDRTALILEIFGDRAATREGVLQVELAHLNYQKGRLVRSWTHLERQRGGLGFVGGPGETQIESDRRLLQERINLLTKRLGKVQRTRFEQRKSRQSIPFPIIALAGYTNAGKSTLFNVLTGSDIKAEDQLFATLDTTVRRAILPHKREVVFSDTVGFIADLPTDLIAAFRGTLEEVTEAHIVLHVRDIANDDYMAQSQDVNDVLADLDVTPEKVPFIEVWNKVDMLSEEELEVRRRHKSKTIPVVEISAHTGEGIDELLATIEIELGKTARFQTVLLPHSAAHTAHWLYEHGEVISATPSEDNEAIQYEVRVLKNKMSPFLEKFDKFIVEPKGTA